MLKKENGSTTMTVSDKKNDTANNYSIEVNTTSDNSKSFEFYYKVENLKLLLVLMMYQYLLKILVILNRRLTTWSIG